MHSPVGLAAVLIKVAITIGRVEAVTEVSICIQNIGRQACREDNDVVFSDLNCFRR